MKLKAIITAPWFKPALGAALTVLCGLLLWGTPLGEAWENASYDYLFTFWNSPMTNQVAFVRMDNDAYDKLVQHRGQPWDRQIHERLLDKLTEDGTRLVVFDVFFTEEKNPVTDAALAAAMRRNGHVILASKIIEPKHPELESAYVKPPAGPFKAAAANFGAGKANDEGRGEIVRRHWPFLAPGADPFHSLGWAAAQSLGAHLDEGVEKQWLRYYGEKIPAETFSYPLALDQAKGHFRDKIIFIGNWPNDPDPAIREDDKFRTPYARWNPRWTREAIGGVEIMATTFLNLVNGDWLRRPPEWLEAFFLCVTGVLIGLIVYRFRRLRACLVAAALALTVLLVFVLWSYYTNYWFPWLVIAGGQVPCALAWTLLAPRRPAESVWTGGMERFPGYTTLGEPFGEGAYGKVWLVRNATGQWQALKEIERAKFEDEEPYDREFRGIKNYKPFSNQHPGLLHIDHVNRNDRAGYFYYVMELGDPLDPDWEQKGEPYQPRDLSSVCQQADLRRLSAHETIRIGIALAEALDYLHSQELVHRDIKPSNVVFVQGRPKFADVGLVREAPDAGEERTQVFTEYYRAPDGVGTKLADIYALGMTLYVVSTGKHPRSFSELSTTLVAKPGFMRLNEIICQACQPSAAQRYTTAAEMLRALRAAQQELDADPTRQI